MRRAPPSGRRSSRSWTGLRVASSSSRPRSAGSSAPAAAPRSRSCSRTTTSTSWASCGTRPMTTRPPRSPRRRTRHPAGRRRRTTTAPALMGNTVLWKPSPTQQVAAHLIMRLLEEAGLPPGVINMLPGDGLAVSEVALPHPDLGGIHFTGSTATFQHLWRAVGENITAYKGYPRIVGETGGKDFVLAHSSADPDVLRVALLRGAFEYQGQKCSAASRAYVARSVWDRMRDDLVAETEALSVGDVTDFSHFMGAVIDDRAFRRHREAFERAHATDHLTVLAGGTCDDSTGWFLRPTIVESSTPKDDMFRTEYFGPVLAVHVYEDAQYEKVVDQMERFAPYALTGSVVAQDRRAVAWATT